MSGKAPNERKRKKKKKVLPKGPDGKDVDSMAFAMLNSKVDGLQTLLGDVMGQIQAQKIKTDENFTKFVFHDHRRVDTSGPQYYNTDFEKAWLQEQERQKAAQQPPAPPKPASPVRAPAKSDKRDKK